MFSILVVEDDAALNRMICAKLAKAQGLDAIHDNLHEIARDEARHGRGFEGLFNRYFKK